MSLCLSTACSIRDQFKQSLHKWRSGKRAHAGGFCIVTEELIKRGPALPPFGEEAIDIS